MVALEMAMAGFAVAAVLGSCEGFVLSFWLMELWEKYKKKAD